MQGQGLCFAGRVNPERYYCRNVLVGHDSNNVIVYEADTNDAERIARGTLSPTLALIESPEIACRQVCSFAMKHLFLSKIVVRQRGLQIFATPNCDILQTLIKLGANSLAPRTSHSLSLGQIGGNTMGYCDVYENWQSDPEAFWMKAAEAIDWDQAPTKALFDENAPLYEWYSDAKVNTCYNAVDRPR